MNVKNTVLGLDIGTSHIKAVSIYREKNRNTLLRYAIGPSFGLATKIASESEIDNIAASEILKNFLDENGFKDTQAVAVISEQRVFSKVISMPNIENNKDFKQAIEWEAEQHLPQSLSDVYLKYTIQKKNSSKKEKEQKEEKTSTVLLGTKDKYIKKAIDFLSLTNNTSQNKTESTIDVLLVSVLRGYVDRYLSVINRAGLAPLGLEPTSISSIRGSILTGEVNVPTIIINFGYSNTDFYFCVDNNLRFVRPISLGTSSAIRAISEALDVSPIQANEYLYTYGLQRDLLNGKVSEIIMPVMRMLIEEFEKSKQYIESREALFGEEPDKRIRRILLMGGGALIPNIMVYLIQNISVEVEMADAWKTLDISLVGDLKTMDQLKPLFVAAVGAGLK
ncbi:hypothetical protein COV25_02990 [candidate division WWE3 bacterium CG10_big_fil_rev_8_21_14_0_10_35_32]|nr:MAG: hypothetical protein COV25_02990 [candidate division WWE3 bacterium CG10_big_fil_rev_8_21_14_0_10_35_32]